MLRQLLRLLGIAVLLAFFLGCLALGTVRAADNVAITPGTGATAATRDIGGGVQAPKVVIIDPNGNLMSTSQGLQVFVPNGVTQSGTWTVQPGNTANTTPWLATVNQGGNSAAVAAAGSAYGNALAVAGGITPGTATTTNPLSDPILAAVTTPGTNAGANWRNLTAGSLQVASITSAGAILNTPASGISFRYTARQQTSYAVAVTGANGARTLQNLAISIPNAQGFIGLKLYDTAPPTAPTCSSATNLVHFFTVPNTVTGGFLWQLPFPVDFANGIGFCLISAQGLGTGSWIDTSSTNFTNATDANGTQLNGIFR